MTIDIDRVLQAIGETGPYQRRVYFLLCLPVIFVGAANFAYVFIAATPRSRCFIEGCDSKDHTIFDAPFVNFSIPWNSKSETLEQCKQYKRNESLQDSDCYPEDFTKSIENCEAGIIFDTSVFESTIVSEFNLTCGTSWQASADQSIFFGGILVGCFLFGLLSDTYGRRLIILISVVLMALSGVGVALIQHIYTFHVLRFVNAMASAGLFQTAFILGLEFVGPSKRVMFGTLGQYFFAIGEIILGLTAWAVRDWRMLQLIISTPAMGFIFYYWVVPESLRWLQTKGRHIEVISSLENIAKVNRTTLPLNALVHRAVDENEIENMELTHLLSSHIKISILDVLRKPVLVLRIVFLIFIWITTTLCYYGLSYSTQDIEIGDRLTRPFIFFILSAVVELPGYTIAWFGMEFFGRQRSLVTSLFLAGIFTIGIGYVKSFAYILTLFMVGKCFITSAFGIIYIFTAELFPTSVRNTVIGTCSMFARFGGMLAPFSSNLKSIYPPLPMLVFGGLSTLCALFSLVLPETRNTSLPDTLSDAINLGRNTCNAGLNNQSVIQASNGEDENLINVEENGEENVRKEDACRDSEDSDDPVIS